MDARLFDEMISEFPEIVRYRKTGKTALRVARFTRPERLKPAQIREIRKKYRASQSTFAQWLGASLEAVRSWEQGTRRPRGTALRLLNVAKNNPAAFLQY